VASTDASKLPSTAAHTDSTAAASTTAIPATTNIEPLHKDTKIEGVTAPVDAKTNAATQAAIISLQDDTKNLNINDKSTTGDGLVSAKKVAEGEGVHTGVKSDLSAPSATEPISKFIPNCIACTNSNFGKQAPNLRLKRPSEQVLLQAPLPPLLQPLRLPLPPSQLMDASLPAQVRATRLIPQPGRRRRRLA